jgi:hypothetical protein
MTVKAASVGGLFQFPVLAYFNPQWPNLILGVA